MSQSQQASSEQRIVAQGRELMRLSRRAIALAEALQALTGLQPAEAREQLKRLGGELALTQMQEQVAATLERAELAARQAVGPWPATLHVNRRARARHQFI